MNRISSIKWYTLFFVFMVFFLFPSGNINAAAKKEILIGAPVALTGPLAKNGDETAWAYQQAVDDINEKGGIYVKEYGKKLPVKLILADTESEGSKASAATEKLIKLNNVDVLLSGVSTQTAIAQCIIAEKYKKYLHGVISMLGPWRAQNFKWSTMFFQVADTVTEAPFRLLESLPASQRPKRIALLWFESVEAELFAKGWLKAGKKYGGYSFPVQEDFPMGSQDFTAHILKMKRAGVDGVIFVAFTPDSVALIRQMKENNLSVPFLMGYAGTWPDEFYQALGKDAEYVLFDAFWHKEFPTAGSKELGERFYQKYKKQSVGAGLHYAQMQILFTAIERAGTLDSKTLRDTVAGHEFKGTVMGDVQYKDDGSAEFLISICQWQDGKQRLILPASEGGARYIPAVPWDER